MLRNLGLATLTVFLLGRLLSLPANGQTDRDPQLDLQISELERSIAELERPPEAPNEPVTSDNQGTEQDAANGADRLRVVRRIAWACAGVCLLGLISMAVFYGLRRKRFRSAMDEDPKATDSSWSPEPQDAGTRRPSKSVSPFVD